MSCFNHKTNIFFRLKRKLVIFCGMFLASFFLIFSESAESQAAPRSARVRFPSIRDKKGVTVQVEIPKSSEEFERGLMFRKSLSGHQGMLFMFPSARPLSFWMRNTYIPLDMIFLDEALRVVWMEENAKPLDETPRSSPVPAQFVVEVVGGFSHQHGIHVGTQATFLDILKTKRK